MNKIYIIKSKKIPAYIIKSYSFLGFYNNLKALGTNDNVIEIPGNKNTI